MTPEKAPALDPAVLPRTRLKRRSRTRSSTIVTPRRKAHTLLLVGRNRRTRSYLEELEQLRVPSVMVTGVLDLENEHGDGRDECSDILDRLQVPCLGHVRNLPEVLAQNPVDEVFITLPFKSCYAHIEEAGKICEEAGVPVSLSVDLFDRSIAQSGTVRSSGRITYSCVPYPRWKLALKRLMDIAGSVAALAVFAVPMIIMAIAIRMSSKGPIFFRQRRVGLNHKPFNMLKFRTMVVNAEEMKSNLEHLNEQQGPVFKIENDPRVTRIGRFLRRFSLDELPQFFNVLRGDMSLVGPRPPLPAEVAQYEWWQRRRLSMKPGLTCYWQVMGRNRIGFEEWMRLDLQYIDNWSLTRDLHLMLHTVPVVFTGSGAS